MTSFMIGPHKVDRNGPPLFIAEAGLSHFGSLSKAVSLIHFAARAGADFIKFQHFDPNDLYALDANKKYRDRALERALPDAHMYMLSRIAESEGITFLCTPHTEQALDFLVKECKVSAIKIGSGEVGNTYLLRKAKETGLPILLSVGMHTAKEIADAVKLLDGSPLCLLHCISEYPTDPGGLRLGRINVLQETYKHLPIGYSHHGEGPIGMYIAAGLGACVIERHVCLGEDYLAMQDQSADVLVSANVQHLSVEVNWVREAHHMASRRPPKSDQEKQTRLWAKKVVVTKCSLMKGAVIEPEMITLKRGAPAGYEASHIPMLVGATVAYNIPENTTITQAMIEN